MVGVNTDVLQNCHTPAAPHASDNRPPHSPELLENTSISVLPFKGASAEHAGHCLSRASPEMASWPIGPEPNSATGTQTRVARVRAEYPDQLDYSGVEDPYICINTSSIVSPQRWPARLRRALVPNMVHASHERRSGPLMLPSWLRRSGCPRVSFAR